MPYREHKLVAGEYYHVFNRGNDRQPIFFEQANMAFFLRQSRKYIDGNGTQIIAYCLMPNHYHLLLCPTLDSLSRQLQLFTLSYTKAINKRYNRVGSLFQGRFKGAYIDHDGYLLHLSRYIHLNPVTAGLVKRAEDWEFSSYREFIGIRFGTLPKPDVILRQFNSCDDYRLFVESYNMDDRKAIVHLLFDD
jgi:putative transposase